MAAIEQSLYQKECDVLATIDGERKAFWDERAEKCKDNDAELSNLSAEDKKKLDSIHGRLKDQNQKVQEFKEFATVAGHTEALQKVTGLPIDRPTLVPTNPNPNGVKTLGQQIIESKEMQKYLGEITGSDGEVTEGSFKKSPRFDAKALILTSATSGGALVRRDYMPTVSLPLQPLSVRDVISVLRTNSNLIEFVRVTAFTNAAARVPEATSTTDDAALKPESSIALEIVQTAVKTIAHFFAITRQILSDAPQLQTIIDTFGRDGLELVLEEKIINGAGGADFLGLDNTPGLTQQAFDTSMLVTTRKARTKVKYTGRASATAYILNPIDWETLDLTVDNEARYYFGGPMVLGTPRLWGLPVVECEPVRQGTGYTGDMKQAVLWDRESATMHITDSNRDWFERNILAILFELRAAFGVLRPAAIVRMDLHAGANS
jgi:HK97 family phage major capsid protein